MKYCIFDTESTGLNTKNDCAFQLGAFILDENLQVIKVINEYFNVDKVIHPDAVRTHGIDKFKLKKLSDNKCIEDKIHLFQEFFTSGNVFIGYNVDFDLHMLNNSIGPYGTWIKKTNRIQNFDNLLESETYSYCLMKDLSKKVGYNRWPKLTDFFRQHGPRVSTEKLESHYKSLCDRFNIGKQSLAAHDALWDTYMTTVLFVKHFKLLRSDWGGL